MTNEKSEIVYGRDIVRTVAMKSGIPERKVKYVFDFFFSHVKKKAREPGVFSINLPKIGLLYLSTERYARALKDREIKDHVSSRQKAFHKEMKTKVQEFDELFKEKAQGRYLKTVHRKGLNIYNHYLTKGLGLEQLEVLQNEENI